MKVCCVIPYCLLNADEFSLTEKVIWSYIASHLIYQKQPPSKNEIASDLTISKRTLDNAIANMVEKNLLIATSPKITSGNRYAKVKYRLKNHPVFHQTISKKQSFLNMEAIQKIIKFIPENRGAKTTSLRGAESTPIRGAKTTPPIIQKEDTKVSSKKACTPARGFDPKKHLEYFLPIQRNNKQFVSTWQDFCDYRNTIKKQLTQMAVSRIANKFQNITTEDAIYLMDLTIENGWTGIAYDRLEQKKKFSQNGQTKEERELAEYREKHKADYEWFAELERNAHRM